MDEPKRRRRSGSDGGSGRGSGGDSGRGSRALKQKVRTARGRKLSSTRWLERQLNDPFVAAAKEAGYRSRAAFKLIEIDDRFQLLKPGARVVDLGAAPGGWTQIAVARTGADKTRPGEDKKSGKVVAADILDMDPMAGAEVLKLDFLAEGAAEEVKRALGGPADVVLSDMAAGSTGHKQTDHLRIVALCEAAFAFARDVLSENGAFVAKVFQGGTEAELLNELKSRFKVVHHVKPKSSRAESAEQYVVATGFKGA